MSEKAYFILKDMSNTKTLLMDLFINDRPTRSSLVLSLELFLNHFSTVAVYGTLNRETNEAPIFLRELVTFKNSFFLDHLDNDSSNWVTLMNMQLT